MKKILALILLSFSLQSQTLIKPKQIEGSTSGSVLTTTGTGTPTWTNTLPYSILTGTPTLIGAYEPKLNGTGFVKSTGTVTSYDNTSYIPTSSVSAFQPTVSGGYLTVSNPLYTGSLTTGALTYTDTGILAAFQSSTNGYNQVIVSNTSNAANASANFIAGNNLGTASNNFVELGMNSSTFTGTTIFDQPNAGYLAATSGTLNIGTRTAHPINIAANNSSIAAITVSTLNAVNIPTLTATTLSTSGTTTANALISNSTLSVGTTATITGLTSLTSYSASGTNTANALIANTTLSVGTTATLTGAVRAVSNLSVAGSFSAGTTATVSGAMVAASTLSVGTNLQASGTMSITGASTLTGAIRASNNLSVTGTFSAGSTSTLTGQVKQTNTLNLEGNTTWNTNQTNTLTTGNSGTVAVLSDAVFQLTFYTTGVNPADASTYYMANCLYGLNTGPTFGRHAVPYNCRLVGYSYSSIVDGVAASAESSTLSVRINNTTDVTINASQTYSTSTLNSTSMALSTDLNAGDLLNVKWVTPTWATNPTLVYNCMTLYFIRRQ